LCSVYGLRESQINKDGYTYAVLLFTPPSYSQTHIFHILHFCCLIEDIIRMVNFWEFLQLSATT
jgi:hypothetical protein